jgi:hypothetical protein
MATQGGREQIMNKIAGYVLMHGPSLFIEHGNVLAGKMA